MRQRVDHRLLAEIRARSLRFTCRDCLFFLPATAGDGSGSCAHFWPNAEHLEPPAAPAVTDGAEPKNDLVFCKEFDLR